MCANSPSVSDEQRAAVSRQQRKQRVRQQQLLQYFRLQRHLQSESRPHHLHQHFNQPLRTAEAAEVAPAAGQRRRRSGLSTIAAGFVLLAVICQLLMAVSAAIASNGAAGNGGGQDALEHPFFDDISPRNVTAVIDDTAILKCRVKNKGNRTVSWMRKRDLHILTTSIYTYTGDQRFEVLHNADTDDWDLRISFAQPRDAGIYECQVNTEPKINLAVHLDVNEHGMPEPPPQPGDWEHQLQRTSAATAGGSGAAGRFYGAAGWETTSGGRVRGTVSVARARITGSPEVHVKKGSTISLSCSINVHASSVAWFHDQNVVDFDSVRGGISLETEKTESGTSSRLMLTRANMRDTGNYTCRPAGALSASVMVHVLHVGEHPAAMQTSSSDPLPPSTATLVLLCLLSLGASQMHRGAVAQAQDQAQDQAEDQAQAAPRGRAAGIGGSHQHISQPQPLESVSKRNSSCRWRIAPVTNR